VTNAKTKGLDEMNFKQNYKNNLVFDEMEEWQLQDYLLITSKHHHSLTTVENRKLAFQFARKTTRKHHLDGKQIK